MQPRAVITEKKEEILRERVRLAMKQMGVMQASSILVALTLSFLVRNAASTTNILFWLGGVAAVAAVRWVLAEKFKKVEASVFNGANWEKAYNAATIFSGVVWGSSAFLVFPAGDMPLVSLFVLSITSMSAGISVSHSALRYGPAAWIAPTVAAYSLRFFIIGGEYGYSLGFLLILFATAILIYSLKHNDSITESISLQFKNLDLLEEVRNATKMKDQFVTLVSHDLKSPFNSIMGLLQIISTD